MFDVTEGARLPSGRHRLTREDVVRSQRGRAMFALMQAVADKGYATTTLSDIVNRAGVSRSTFYEHFSDKEDCFLQAFDTGVEIVLTRIREAAETLPKDDWRAHVRSDLVTYLEVLSNEPAFAWSLHVEVMAAGPAALARRAAVVGMFTERTRRAHEMARTEDPSLPELPREAFVLHSGGLDEMVREHLREHGAATLPTIAEPALRATFALFGAPR
jgi:AcrR family transcriptional regulator